MDAQTFQAEYDMTPQQVQARVAARAWKDRPFKDTLMNSPKEAIEEECGISLPADFEIRVAERTDGYLPIVIPQPPAGRAEGSVEDVEVLLTPDVENQDPRIRELLKKQARLMAKAWTDETFLEEAVSSPRPVLERELDVELPSTVEVEVLVDSDSVGHMVLPQDPNAESDELSDEQLEAVAGGATPTVAVLTVTLVMGGGAAATMVMGNVVANSTEWDPENFQSDSGGLDGLGW